MPVGRSQPVRRLAVVLITLLVTGIGIQVAELGRLPFLGMSERGARVALVDPAGPAAKAGLRHGDLIVSIAGRPTQDLVSPSTFLRRQTPGSPLEIEVRRDGARLSTVLVPESLPPGEVFWNLAHALVAVVFALTGGLVFLQQQNLRNAVFCVLCCFMAMLLFRPYLPMNDLGDRMRVVLVAGGAALLPGLLLHFFLLFPQPRPRLERSRGLAALLYVPAVPLLFLALAALWNDPALEPRSRVHLAEDLTALYWSIALVLSVVFFLRAYAKYRLVTVRRRLRVTLAGTALGLLPLVLVIVAHLAVPDQRFPLDRLATVSLVFLPLSFGYAILRERFLDTEWIVKRGLVSAGLTLGALLVFFAFTLGGPRLEPKLAGLDRAVGTGLLVVWVVAVLGPWSHRLHDRLDHAFNPDRYDIGRPLRALARMLQRASSNSRREWVLLATVGRVLGTHRAVFFRPDAAGGFLATASLGARSSAAHRISPVLAEPVFAHGEPMLRGDLESILAARALPPGDLAALDALSASVLVPLATRRERLGLLVLGGRSFSEPYATPELEFLEGLQNQAALALENAELRDRTESAEGLRREIASAHAVQQQLLPHSLPRLGSVEVAAICRPRGEVGGDYYDCWFESRNGASPESHAGSPRARTGGPGNGTPPGPGREEGELILAVGDVSGKGVPAALLMASVQATFRAEADAGRPPGEILYALNRRLCGMERPDRFVSFFCARYDVESRELRYANAGHLPPLLVGADGQVRGLSESGLLLGIRKPSEYGTSTTRLSPGDLLVLFTDGLTERDGPAGRFDETHLGSLVASARNLSAQDLLQRILENFDDGVGITEPGPADDPLADDTTVVVLKVL